MRRGEYLRMSCLVLLYCDRNSFSTSRSYGWK